jgi:hypothetical protein
MTDPTQRVNSWTIKTDTGKVKAILDDARPYMLKHYEAAVASLCEMETKARQTLNSAGVQTILYVPYLSYARQLYKLSRQGAYRARASRFRPRSCSTDGRAAVWTPLCSRESEPRCSMLPHPRRKDCPYHKLVAGQSRGRVGGAVSLGQDSEGRVRRRRARAIRQV